MTQITTPIPSLAKEYIFLPPKGVAPRPKYVKEKPVLIAHGAILFHFDNLDQTTIESEFIDLSDILAEIDNENGTAQFNELSGRFNILNPKVLKKSIRRKILTLRVHD